MYCGVEVDDFCYFRVKYLVKQLPAMIVVTDTHHSLKARGSLAKLIGNCLWPL
jgi:hypothetical protein